MKKVIFLILLCGLITIVENGNILVVAPTAAHSHFTVAFTLAKELSVRGHQITCINPYPRKEPIKNYRDVSVEENILILEEHRNSLFAQGRQSPLRNLKNLFDMAAALAEQTLKNTNVEKLLKSDENFDVVIIEYFLNDALVGFGYHYKAPVIILSSVASNTVNNRIFGNPAPNSYIPGIFTAFTTPMNFWQRLQNLLMNSVFEIFIEFYYLPQQRRLFNEYFTKNITLDEVLYNSSLMLSNSHVSVSDAVPHVPCIIEIGGYHIQPPRQLPDDLQNYLDNSKEGIILFSLGSNLRSKDLKPEIRDGILKAFSKIKQNVLWKFENDLVNIPNNVKIMKWLPQQDILAHPNMKAFISHGGFLSTIETVYHGVPVIGIPVFGDQKHNVATAVSNGYAISIVLDELTEEKFSWALNEILNNSKYRESVQQRSKLMRDQPLKPIDSAVFWVEHVIRHKGAAHLRSAALDLKWYQREMIDIISFFVFLLTLILTIFYLMMKKMVQFLFCKKAMAITENKKQQ